MSVEKKKRTKLTMTTMIEAASDIYLSTLSEEERENSGPCSVILRADTDVDNRRVFGASLWRHPLEGAPEEVAQHYNYVDFEGAVASVLSEMEQVLESRKAQALKSIHEVSDRYKSILRGARSKLKEGVV